MELLFYINFALHYNPPIKIEGRYTKEIAVTNVLSIFQNNEVPNYTETLIGTPQEPLSFIILARDDKQLIDAFLRAGWYLADNASFASVRRLARAALFNGEYPTAPVTPYFWNAKVHDFGFEKPADARSVKQRHHARFWKTKYKTQNGRFLYVGTASFDFAIKWGITHKIRPDIDTEREFLFTDLSNTKLVAEFQKLQFVEPVLGKNFLGDQFFTDGEIYILNIR